MKAMLVDASGKAVSERLRVPTPEPATPDAILQAMRGLAQQFPQFDYAACGFPGVIKQGVVYTAHNLNPAWVEYDLQDSLQRLLKAPARVANDAAVQGMAAIRGEGVELCITLGTGMGSSLFVGGVLVPGLELGHHPLKGKRTYEDYLGRAGLERLGKKKWNKKLRLAIDTAQRLFNYDYLHIGGGNTKYIDFELPGNARLVQNTDGLLGGAALWRDVIATRKTLAKEK